MGFLDIFRHRSVYALRKQYDRVREKADRERNLTKKMQALRMLDRIDPTLTMLEEQQIASRDRSRFYLLVKQGVEQARFVLEQKEEKKPAGH